MKTNIFLPNSGAHETRRFNTATFQNIGLCYS